MIVFVSKFINIMVFIKIFYGNSLYSRERAARICSDEKLFIPLGLTHDSMVFIRVRSKIIKSLERCVLQLCSQYLQ